MPDPSGARPGPRVYRPDRLRTGLTIVIGLAFIAGGIVLAITDSSDSNGHGLWSWLPAVALLAAAGAASIAAILVDRVVVSEDAIEVRQLGFGRRCAPLDQIRGARGLSTQHLTTLELGPGTKPIRLGRWYGVDAELDAWLRSLPDLDAEDRARQEAEILARSALGPTPEHRAAALARARRIARVVEGAGVLVSFWGGAYPRPYAVALTMLVIVPIVAVSIIATGRGLYQLQGRHDDIRPRIALAIALPALALGLRGASDLQVLDLWTLAPWIPVIALSLVALAVAPERDARVRWKNALLLAPLLAVYAGGVLVLADTMLDRAPRETHRVEVLGKQAVGRRHRSWELELAPWGPVEERDTYRVPGALFHATVVGTEVCAEVGEGALGARWYVIRACR